MNTDRGTAGPLEPVLDSIIEEGTAAGHECEVYAEDVSRRRIEVYRGKVESLDSSRELGIGLRLSSGGRTGFAWTSDLTPAGLEAVLECAARNCAVSALDEVDRLAPLSQGGKVVRSRACLPWPDVSELASSVMEMERAALEYGEEICNIEGCGYSDQRASVMVRSSRGLSRSEQRRCCTCWTGAVAGTGSGSRSGWYSGQARDPAKLDFTGTGRKAAARASSLLGGRPLPSGKYPVVFDPAAFTEFVDFMAESLSGERLVKGTSVMGGLLGQRIAPPFFDLVDDPFLDQGCRSASFDDEGVDCEVRRLVKEGTLESFMHTSWSAARSGASRGGNAVRRDFRTPPCPGPTNMAVMPGSGGLEDLIEEVGEGLYVQDVMGMHTADPVSGDFSVGMNGRRIKGGRLAEAYCEMTLGGNILSLLRGVRRLGGETVFMGSCGSPAVLAEGLGAGGK